MKEQLLFLLKTRGPLTAQQAAALMGLTSMGARKHLETWHEAGLVEYVDQAEKQGRPSRYWQLSAAGHGRFPDRHSELTLQLLQHVRQLFGEKGVDQLITAREAESLQQYKKQTEKFKSLNGKLKALADIRSLEGYMAEVEKHEDGGYILIENHCPICAAASSCQNFCRSELQVFQDALGEGVQVQRTEHLMQQGRRCVYWIRPR
ncbi:transcriptional regulator [Undibacterium sp. LX40W]|uniref:Transcriptional regulator n=1 Tax=Undibacterium nitidum TaxID=2762298 RepID=A0A923HX51_9BURK|nr:MULTISPECIES: metalloregulator ArsR/SmtB family transcription factor [Undibacterium]MBC3881801.1 transcriptional regulator [Undibacterium nitidum]MBC3892202.1 transcriptional regulator [Undibacterium sp. LX40W]